MTRHEALRILNRCTVATRRVRNDIVAVRVNGTDAGLLEYVPHGVVASREDGVSIDYTDRDNIRPLAWLALGVAPELGE